MKVLIAVFFKTLETIIIAFTAVILNAHTVGIFNVHSCFLTIASKVVYRFLEEWLRQYSIFSPFFLSFLWKLTKFPRLSFEFLKWDFETPLEEKEALLISKRHSHWLVFQISDQKRWISDRNYNLIEISHVMLLSYFYKKIRLW